MGFDLQLGSALGSGATSYLDASQKLEALRIQKAQNDQAIADLQDQAATQARLKAAAASGSSPGSAPVADPAAPPSAPPPSAVPLWGASAPPGAAVSTPPPGAAPPAGSAALPPTPAVPPPAVPPPQPPASQALAPSRAVRTPDQVDQEYMDAYMSSGSIRMQKIGYEMQKSRQDAVMAQQQMETGRYDLVQRRYGDAMMQAQVMGASGDMQGALSLAHNAFHHLFPNGSSVGSVPYDEPLVEGKEYAGPPRFVTTHYDAKTGQQLGEGPPHTGQELLDAMQRAGNPEQFAKIVKMSAEGGYYGSEARKNNIASDIAEQEKGLGVAAANVKVKEGEAASSNAAAAVNTATAGLHTQMIDAQNRVLKATTPAERQAAQNDVNTLKGQVDSVKAIPDPQNPGEILGILNPTLAPPYQWKLTPKILDGTPVVQGTPSEAIAKMPEWYTKDANGNRGMDIVTNLSGAQFYQLNADKYGLDPATNQAWISSSLGGAQKKILEYNAAQGAKAKSGRTSALPAAKPTPSVQGAYPETVSGPEATGRMLRSGGQALGQYLGQAWDQGMPQSPAGNARMGIPMGQQ